MARAKPVLACLLLSCLAAAALATPQQGRVSQGRIQKGILANPQAVKGTSANPQAVYDCPDTPRMKGCAATGCALHMHGKSSTLVCAQCASDKAYTLVNENTRKAQCECAPGYAGKGQDGVCKRCPEGTDIAEGGAIAKSVCMKCPKGSYVNAEGTDCTCPAGHYRAAADQAPGFKKIACKPCMARNAYVAEDGHTQESCKSCAAPQVANKDHSGCVMPDDEDAVEAGEGLGSLATRGPLGSLAAAFEEGRQSGREERLKRKAGVDSAPFGLGHNPLKTLASRVRGVNKGSAEEESYEDEDDSKQAAPIANGKTSKAKSSKHVEEDDEEEYVEKSHAKSHHVKSTDKQNDKHETAKAQTESESASADEPAVDNPKSEEPAPKISKPLVEAEADEDETDSEPASKVSKDVAAEEPKPKSKDDSTSAPKAPKEEAPKQAAAPQAPKWSGKGTEPNLAAQLIPGLPAEAEDLEPQTPRKEPTMKELKKMSQEITKEMNAARAPAPTPAAPAGPVTFKDLVKKVGSAFGGAGPVNNPIAAAVGYIDPEALKDAGLPPANNVGELMGSLIKAQLGDLDFSAWKNGVRGATQP